MPYLMGLQGTPKNVLKRLKRPKYGFMKLKKTPQKRKIFYTSSNPPILGTRRAKRRRF